MEFNKKTFLFATIISLLILLISIYINFFTDTYSFNIKRILDFTYTILLNILASSIFLIATSWFNYFMQKRTTKHNILNEILKVRNLFSDTLFEYSESDSYATFCYSNNFFSGIPEDERKKMYEDYEDEKKQVNINKIRKTFKLYDRILNYDFKYLKNSIDDLSCFSDFIMEKKEYLHQNLISYIDIIVLELKKYENVIEQIISGSCTDYNFMFEKIKEINDKIFLNHDIAFKLKPYKIALSEAEPSSSNSITEKNVVLERLDTIIDIVSSI